MTDIPRRVSDAPVPLTPAQERLWFLDRAGFGGSTYHNWWGYRLRGPLDVAALGDALAAVVRRHEALRTAIVEVDGRARQLVHSGPADPLDVVDLTDVPAGERERRAGELAAALIRRPFDFTSPPLLRAALYRFAADHHLLVVCVHHIVIDGAGTGVVLSELFDHFRAVSEGAGPPEPPPAPQFPDYAAWLAGSALDRRDADLAYWRAHLADAPRFSTVATDRPRPQTPSLTSGRHTRVLDAGLAADLRALARAERCTPFTLYLAAVSAALARHSGEEDVVVGTPADTRHTPALERTVGMFANTLALRVRPTGNPTLREVLRTARTTVLRGLGHKLLPFDAVVDALRVPRGRGHNPLFQVMLVVEPGGFDDPPLPRGLTTERWELGAPPARFDLTVIVLNGETVEVTVDYAADLYGAATIDRFCDHVVRLLTAFTTDPERRLWEVDLHDGVELSQVDGPPFVAVTDHIARQRPDALAVSSDTGSLTYAELRQRSTRLAALLRRHGVGPESVVAVLAPSRTGTIVAILAVLRAGGAYLPIDPTHPPARVLDLLTDAGVGVAVADAPDRATLAGFAGTVLSTSDGADGVVETSVRPDQLAYVVYTSGSTGRPKGVQVTHATLANLTRAFVDVHRLDAAQALFMVPPLTFDASVGDVFPALSCGATLVLHPRPASLDGAELLRFTARHAVTAIDVPVSLWRRWTTDFGSAPPPRDWTVSTVMVGGERVPTTAVDAWTAVTGGRVELFNHYGPTEATVCATTHHVPAATTGTAGNAGTAAAARATGDPATHLPIGRPLPHVRAYVLDRYGNRAPVGAPGELYLGGDCLARGYLGRPDLTAERFVADPFRGTGRMYRTGDLVRSRSDGTLEFLGRIDRQVKINGHRIEPAEVEASVVAHPSVTDVAVVAAPGADRLLAYVVTDDGHVPDGLRAFLRGRLPDALVPAVYTAVPVIPRTAHGKLDEAALPPAADAASAEPPRGPAETAIAEIWADALGVYPGRHDNFFALGGHSLLMAGLLAEVRRRLGVTLPLRSMFETDDLADLAALVTGGPVEHAEPDLRAEVVLPADIVPAGARRPVPDRPTILLTGGTGFLGAHLVAELLSRTGATLLCLARADDDHRAADRIRDALRRYGLDAPTDDRIVGLAGDLGTPRFGLDAAALADLAARVDVICHNGGLVNFGEPYHRLRPTNVDSAVDLLRLSALGGGIPLHLVSTLGVYLGKAYVDAPVGEQDPPDDPTGLYGGYNQSKWVADALVRLARGRGIPTTVHRPARISGHSRTGRSNPDDHFNRTLATYVQVGAVPDLAYEEDLAPVDHVAAGIAHLITARRDPGDHHYFNTATISQAEIAAALREHGHPVRLVPWPDWRARILAVRDRGDTVPLDPFLVDLPEEPPQHRRPRFDCSTTGRILAEAGIVCPPADRALLRRQLGALS
ncbi:non-ribosomal peptide synthetase [Virgisporangium ochraceum]|uniref:Non-ribosomal peptide synthetase n=1 Tax=Virgisporangium ochraceum TaxID=65505 RepID=A0A8J3ZUH7_9ACTN|nr:non-ribosomal peptide synthetase [Virgisporangium ochraceum]GIJ70427.1 non-ribosomal peptide synthetase [Virgisporangium ochraceum]